MCAMGTHRDGEGEQLPPEMEQNVDLLLPQAEFDRVRGGTSGTGKQDG